MLQVVFALGLLFHLTKAETVLGRASTNPAVYNCPPRQTIENAYLDYCPGTSPSGEPLTGGMSAVSYSTPGSFQTVSGDYVLSCQYRKTQGSLRLCDYYGGGGSPLTDPTPLDGCPSLSSAVVPQPSPNVNFKRRNGLSNRDLVGPKPVFVCPWDSTTPDLYSEGTEIHTGTSAVDYGELAGQIRLRCFIKSSGNGFTCEYSQDADGNLSFVVTGTGDTTPEGQLCPRTLCSPIPPYRPMKRGLYLDGNEARLRNARVDTGKLRSRLEAKSKRTIKRL